MTRRIRSDATWADAEADYRAGQSARAVCLRYDLGLSAFRERARKGGWRRADLPDPVPASADDAAPLLPAATLADMAHRRAAQSLRAGHAVEAERWTRLQRNWARRAGDRSYYTEAERAVSPPPWRDLGSLRSLAELLGGAAATKTQSFDAPPVATETPLSPVLQALGPDSAAARTPAPPRTKPDAHSLSPPPLTAPPDSPDSPDTPVMNAAIAAISPIDTAAVARLRERLALAVRGGDACLETDCRRRLAALGAPEPEPPPSPLPLTVLPVLRTRP